MALLDEATIPPSQLGVIVMPAGSDCYASLISWSDHLDGWSTIGESDRRTDKPSLTIGACRPSPHQGTLPPNDHPSEQAHFAAIHTEANPH